MYQKAIGSILGLAALGALASADFVGTLPTGAARIITHFEEEVDEGITGEEVDETVKLLRAKGASGVLSWPGGSATV